MFRSTLRFIPCVLLAVSGAVNAGGGGDSTADEAKDYFEQDGVIVRQHDTWLQKALDLQNRIDYQAPLAQATFIMTHNSYNASAYTTAVSYLDPNQSLSIKSQLSAGVRSLELDVHKYFSMDGWPWEWKNRLMLCHGQGNHLGCSSYDRHLEAAFDEIRDWLNEERNRQEVIVVYIEDHMDGLYGDAISIINNRIGNKVYRPTGSGCQGIPMNLSKQAILDAGKQVLIMGGGDVCSAGSGWNTWAYAGVGNRLSGYPTGSVSKIDGESCEFSRSFYDSYWVRFYEDRTNLSNWFSDPETIHDEDARQLQRCGANLIGFDKLKRDDSRLYASIWSWDQNEPNNWGNNEHCAESWDNGRYNDRACGDVLQFACQQPGTHNWYVTTGSGPWASGQQQCASETGGQYRFATPTNGYDQARMMAAKTERGAGRVWLNLHDRRIEGHWEANQ